MVRELTHATKPLHSEHRDGILTGTLPSALTVNLPIASFNRTETSANRPKPTALTRFASPRMRTALSAHQPSASISHTNR